MKKFSPILLIGLLAGLLTMVSCGQAPQKAEFVVQVSLGGWNSADYTAEEVIGRIREVNALIPVKKVIIGWSIDKDVYRQVGEYLHQNDIQMLLWLPVFAETEEVCENVPAVDLAGVIPANYDLAAGEGFRFNCPTRPQTAANVIAIYDNHFKDCGFDGVFLDRIRTQSFVSGVSGVLSCGCPYCKEAFKAEGVDLDAVLAAYNEKGDAFFSVTGYVPESGFTFADPVASAYFKAKGHVVSGAVAAIADSFHERGLEVGMDLYAPFMAPFVGQDYSILSKHADFIKPMLYRQTFAPAGMGFEYDLLRKAVPGAQGYPEFKMDVDFLDSQLKAMEPYACGKYPGIEINYREKVVPTSPEYVTESLETVMRHGFDGAVLSWNIMEAPDSHISCLDPNSLQNNIKVTRIWDSEKHCAFTSLTSFEGRYYVAFREAGSHIFEADGSARGQIRILESRNGKEWKSVACLSKEGYDLRDPSLSVTPDGRLLVSMGGSVYVDKKLVGRDPMYSESNDGRTFSNPEPIEIVSPNATGEDWLWKVDWYGDTGYGVVYSEANKEIDPDNTTIVFLVKTKDGVHYEDVTKINLPGFPNEASVHFLPDGRMLMLLRQESLDRQGIWGVSEPPYTDWKLTKIGFQVGGPNFIVLNDSTIIAGTRSYLIPGSYRTMLLKGGLDGHFEQMAVLPSNGDTSYPGFLVVGDELWVSYYSSHATPKAAVYLAKIPLKSLY